MLSGTSPSCACFPSAIRADRCLGKLFGSWCAVEDGWKSLAIRAPLGLDLLASDRCVSSGLFECLTEPPEGAGELGFSGVGCRGVSSDFVSVVLRL